MTLVRNRFRRLLALAVLVCVVPPVAAGDGGLAPGVAVGWGGVIGPHGALRFVAIPSVGNTLVAAIRVKDGQVIRWRTIKGGLGIPQVAFDATTKATTDGVSANGRTLVLASFATIPVPGVVTRFAILRAPSLRPIRVIVMRGLWSFDAISPDGSTLYAIEYTSTGLTAPPTYRVRAIDVARGRVAPGAIVDRREPGEVMRGQPLLRIYGDGRRWVYTLYVRPSRTLFVHALDTVGRRTVCLDLPWRRVNDSAWQIRMAVDADERTLTLTQPRVGRLATIDLHSFDVRAVRRPRE